MILITGADGLLGSWIRFRFPKDTIGYSKRELNIINYDDVREVLTTIRPDAVINCAGITPQADKNGYGNPIYSREVNGTAPHVMASVCDEVGAKFIQVSTDCVFSGRRGRYTEAFDPDGNGRYALTKISGEITDSNQHLTVRTSFVGWPDPKNRSLLAWLYDHRGGAVQGWRGVRWNGLTAPALAEYLMQLAYDRTSGILHLFGETITKYDLLQTANRVYNWDVKIFPVDEPVSDMTLASVRNREYIPTTANFEEMCREMKKWEMSFLASQLHCR